MAARSGQITVSSSGTAVVLGLVTDIGYAYAFKAHPDNAGVVYVGNDGAGDVTTSNGYPLDAGEQILVEGNGPNEQINLAQYWADAATGGDKVAWLRLR